MDFNIRLAFLHLGIQETIFWRLRDRIMSRKPLDNEHDNSDGKLASEAVAEEMSDNFPGWAAAAGGEITKHGRAEGDLSEQQRFTQSLIEAAPMLTYIYDLTEQRNLYISSQATQILGYAAAEITAMGESLFAKLLHPEDANEVAARLKDILASPSDEIYEIEYRMRRKDGEWVWLLSRDRVFKRDSQGNPTQILGVATDITERRRTEEALREAELQFRATFEQAAVGIAHVATDGTWLMVNERLCEIVGYTQAELLAITFQDITHPEDLAADLDLVRQILAGEINTYSMEKRYVRKDASPVWVNLTVSLVCGSDGAARYFISVVEDITTRKQVERDRAYLATLVESSQDAIFGLTLDRIITSWNAGAEKMLGYTAAEIIGQPLTKLIPADKLEETRRVIAEFDRNALVSPYDSVRLRKDGSRVDVSVSLIPIRDANGTVIGISVMWRDITENKRCELNAAFLAEISQNLARLDNADEILQTVSRKIGAFLALSRCALLENNEAADEVTVLHDWHRADVPALSGAMRFSEFATDEIMAQLRAGEYIVVSDVQNNSRFNAEAHTRLKIGSFISVPLVREGVWKFALAVNHSEAYNWRADEIELMQELTIRLWTRIERARAEELLRESDARLRMAIGISRTATFEIDLLTDVVETDAMGREIYGFSPDEPLTFSKIQARFHPEDAPEVMQKVAAAFDPNGTHTFELEQRIISTNGTTHWIRVHGRAFFEAGKAVRCIGTYIDITESKRRELNNDFLAEITQELTRLSDDREIMCVTAEKIGNYLDASRCQFAEYNEAADEVLVVHDWSASGEFSLVGVHRIADFVHADVVAMLSTGKQFVVNDTAKNAHTSANAEKFAQLEIGSFANSPYLSDGRWKASLTVHCRDAHQWRADKLELLRDLSTRIWTRIERARAELAVKKSEAEFRQLANAVPQIVWVTDGAGKIEYINNVWAKFSGLNLEQTATPEIVAEVIHPNDREKVFDEWARAFETGESFELEARMRENKTGDYCWFLMRSEPSKDAGGKIVKWFGTSTDITNRKQTEQELGVQRRLYQSITDNATTALFIMDEKQQCAFMNPAAEKLTGYTFAETIGRALYDVVHHTRPDGSPFPLAECPIDQAFPTRNQMQGEEIFVHKNGYFYDVAFTASPLLDENGKAVGTVIEVQDITQRKVAEREREKLLASEQEARLQAESANRLKDEFLATVSHELRTPLNAIYGWATMVRNSNYDYDVMRRAFEVIERNAHNQNQIISDILDVSRIITGKLNLDLQPLDLEPVINAAIDTVRPAIDGKRINLETFFDKKFAIVSADGDRIQQIVWNLLSNAVKFTPEEGIIQVSLSYFNGYAEISVSDNGSGIEAEFLPFVFDRFRQADGKTNRQHGGLGLGLAIVRNLIEMHGGSVSVKSEGINNGTTFSVQLPLKAKLTETENNDVQITEISADIRLEQQGKRKILNGLRLLVVDDQPDALELAAFILTEQGAKVFTANSADQALAIFEKESLDAVVSDIGMPQKDGYELIRQIKSRQTESSQSIPVIALTAYAREADYHHALESGFTDFLPKPVEATLLVEKIAEVTKTSV